MRSAATDTSSNDGAASERLIHLRLITVQDIYRI